ncbi:MAG TPA: hypothetical protein VGC42_15495, partial [Kofleriaceae bacterium]
MTAEVLRPGELAPVGAEAGAPVDPVVARAYQHPVLPGRVVVRLAAQPVTLADDLEMRMLGFGPGADRGPVAQQRRRPLGFPGWCLVHDPDHARHALEVVGELKQLARLAGTRPALTKDGLDALAARLGQTAPRCVPSFYEEAGRAFIAQGAPSFAATMFARAREAEAVHALAIDEPHRRATFLEFALAGAVTTRALTEHARDLAAHHAPAEAYADFRQLCVQRTLGGLPPWTGMARDLRRLAKAAGLDPDAQDLGFVEEIIQSPALARAAPEFWRSYAEAITALGRRSPRVRGVLVDLFPAEAAEAWLALLESTGAIDEWVTGDAPAEARSSLPAAAWLDQLCQHGGAAAHVFGLLRRMAPRLVADGAPIAAVTGGLGLDLDLAELALALGVKVQPAPRARLALDRWAAAASQPERGRDPVHAAAHPVIGPRMVEAIGAALGAPAFDAASHGKRGWLAAKRAWLEGQLARAEAGGLPGQSAALDELERHARPELFAELPALHARLAALDVAPALARSLRTGVIDELGWPALEAAAAELAGDGEVELGLHGGLPAAILAGPTRVIAVSPRGRLGAHDLVIPASHELVTARYIGGQFLVLIRQHHRVRGYWSRAPHELFDVAAHAWQIDPVAPRACMLADGAWLERGQPVRAGDRGWPAERIAAADGVTAWLGEAQGRRTIHREVSASGEPGRASWAAFLEA